ncbi:SDR family oxidoreductase [Streptomyces sp. NBC_00080]|uniref:SDR family oxidoreductase n=1 Tax=Streptomyces sp. NBC_00080 TaxID=2975645 RepID=UPI0032486F02
MNKVIYAILAGVTFLITGATGFLGSRVLYELLTTYEHDVVALGRSSPASLRGRVLGALEAVSGRTLLDEERARLRCVSGDVTSPYLGLPPALYGRLAAECRAVWHCAGDIALAGERQRLFAVNVRGTAEMLTFAEQTDPSCRLVHMSTMAVAGGMPTGVVFEDHLSDAYGFETNYDWSKYEAEKAVRLWAQRHSREAIVLRPSVVASDHTGGAGAPSHPLGVLGELIDTIARTGGPGIPSPAERGSVAGVRLRLPVPSDVTFNLVPDAYAVKAMLRVAHDSAPRTGVRAFHIVHPVETSARQIALAIEALHPGLSVSLVDEVVDPTPAESFVAASLPGFLSFRHRRTYDRSNTLALTSGLADPTPIDHSYLVRALAPSDSCGDAYVPRTEQPVSL